MLSLLGKQDARGRPRSGKRGRGRPRFVSTPSTLNTDLVPKKCKQWRDKDMSLAIGAVQCGKLKVSEAVKQFGVPRQTLRDRISGRVVHGTKPGLKPYLTKEEESEFADFLVDTAKAGYGKVGSRLKPLLRMLLMTKVCWEQMTTYLMGGIIVLRRGRVTLPCVKMIQLQMSGWIV